MWYMSALEPLFSQTDNPELVRKFTETVFASVKKYVYQNNDEIGIESFFGIIDNLYTIVQQYAGKNRQISIKAFCESLLIATVVYAKLEIEEENLTFNEFLDLTQHIEFWEAILPQQLEQAIELTVADFTRYLNRLEVIYLDTIQYDVTCTQKRLERLAPILSRVDVYPAFKEHCLSLTKTVEKQTEQDKMIIEDVNDEDLMPRVVDPHEVFTKYLKTLEQDYLNLLLSPNMPCAIIQIENIEANPSNERWAEPVMKRHMMIEEENESIQIDLDDVETDIFSPRVKSCGIKLTAALQDFIENDASSCCLSFFSKKNQDLKLAKACLSLLTNDHSAQAVKALSTAIAFSKCSKLIAHIMKKFGYNNEHDYINNIIYQYPLTKKDQISKAAHHFTAQLRHTHKKGQVSVSLHEHLSQLINSLNQDIKINFIPQTPQLDKSIEPTEWANWSEPSLTLF